MDQLDQIIQNSLKELINSGTRRISYAPYVMDIALDVVNRIGKGIDPLFTLTPEIRPVYIQLIKWFHADTSFEGDINKGILLQGPTGTGKTLAMKIMRVYQTIDSISYILNKKAVKMGFSIVDVTSMVSAYAEHGYIGIWTYDRCHALCLDDIGAEINEAKHFGNNCDVIGHILTERYTRGLMTLGTTNFKVDTLEEKYGDRVASRMHSIFNFIVMKGPDFRKITKNRD